MRILSATVPAHSAPTEADLEAPLNHWSTEQVDPQRALAYWADAVCAQFIELDIDTPHRNGFRARMDQLRLGPVMLNFLEADAQLLHRTTAQIAKSREPVCVLVHMRAGHFRLRHRGREALAGPGQCVLMDSTEPYDIDCIGRTSALALRLPRGWLQFWVPSPADCVAQTFGSGGWSGALNAALASLDLESVGQLALPPSSVAEQLAALIALAAGGRLNDAPRTGRLEKLRRAIRDRLHEPDLVPQSLAQQFNISKRYLHQLFAAGGTTFGRELMALRLERARELLQDRRFATLPVSEIAARCGFEDPSHFSRRFRRRFGEAPRECRGAHPRGEADAG